MEPVYTSGGYLINGDLSIVDSTYDVEFIYDNISEYSDYEEPETYHVEKLLIKCVQNKLLCLAMLEIDPLCGKYFTYEVNENLKKLLTSENPNEYNLGINLWKNINKL